MDTIVNLYASATGIWKKVAAFLPLVAGAGSILVGAGGILNELSSAANAAAALHVAQGLASDPNTAMVIAGLTALGIHSNHADNKAAIAAVPAVNADIPK